MRIWEVDDIKTMPADMVREQDFIMRVRRMHRAGETRLIVNVVFDALEVVRSDRTLKENLQKQVEAATRDMGGDCHLMANGDAFVVLQISSAGDRDSKVARIAQAALPPGSASDDTERMIRSFTMPADYTPLRERTNHYIDAARAASTLSAAHISPQQALQAEQVRGPLTAWSLDQIERLLGEIDISRYVRKQPIYHRADEKTWKPVCEEYFISIEDLKNERFPRLNIRTPERLFMELCCTLDRRLLMKLTESPDSWANTPVNINLSADTILSSTFAQFCRAVAPEKRALVGFELNRADLLLDFSVTRNAIGVLRKEGFRTCIDGLHPDVLPYLNIDAFGADYYKLRVTKDLVGQFSESPVIESLKKLPVAKIIFYRCDNETALEIGARLGVNKFQGWLIDDVVHHRHNV
ncbi:MAG: EAL domain-containing protein [Alphaproteobacteria bacterium]|nr:EAL domain-containing protein [Alphaproteobacteria bacterium]